MTDSDKSIRYSLFGNMKSELKKINPRHGETKGYINSEPRGQMRRKKEEKQERVTWINVISNNPMLH